MNDTVDISILKELEKLRKKSNDSEKLEYAELSVGLYNEDIQVKQKSKEEQRDCNVDFTIGKNEIVI